MASDRILKEDLDKAVRELQEHAIKGLLAGANDKDPSYYRGMYAAVKKLQGEFDLTKELF